MEAVLWILFGAFLGALLMYVSKQRCPRPKNILKDAPKSKTDENEWESVDESDDD